jgi:hypothetical protein
MSATEIRGRRDVFAIPGGMTWTRRYLVFGRAAMLGYSLYSLNHYGYDSVTHFSGG